MPWSLKVTNHASHMVYRQQAANSCGIACVIMLNFKMKKWQIAAAAMTVALPVPGLSSKAFGMAFESTLKSEKEVYHAYEKVTGKKYDGTTYTNAFMLVKVLNLLGLGNWVVEFYPDSILPGKIARLVDNARGAPIIAHMVWNGGARHFIVCDTIRRLGGKVFGDFCDPADGSARTFALINGQSIDYDRDGSNEGALSGWIVYRKGD